VVEKMINKSVFTFLLLFILICPLAYSQASEPTGDIVVTSEIINNSVRFGEWAQFEVTIENNQMDEDTFFLQIAEEGSDWSMLTEPLVDFTSGIKIGAGGTRKTTLLLTPKDALTPNELKPYNLALRTESFATADYGETIISIYYLPPGALPPIVYETDVTVSFDVPEMINPRKKYSAKVNLENNNPREIKNLTIKLSSNLISQEENFELEPQNKKTIDFTLEFDPELEPQQDTLLVEVSEEGETIFRQEKVIKITELEVPVKQETEVEEKFMKTVQTVTLTNENDYAMQHPVKLETSFWQRIFSKAEPEAVVVEEAGIKYYSWNAGVPANSVVSIVLTTSYRPIAYAVIIIVLIGLGVVYFKDPVRIRKSLESFKTYEGGINELKILIDVKNRTHKELENVTIADFIPKLATLVKKHEVGTLKPSKHIQSKRGTVLKWNIEKLDPKEERLITYSIKSTLSIVGGFKLPPAKVVFHDAKGKEVKARSNQLDVAGPEEKPLE
jgi:hypothetical protein